MFEETTQAAVLKKWFPTRTSMYLDMVLRHGSFPVKKKYQIPFNLFSTFAVTGFFLLQFWINKIKYTNI